jgi:vacuolar-type H+-ATPase subunit F/Vma7
VGLLVVLGEAARVDGFALGGATVIAAESPDAVRRAWTSLPDDLAVVMLTHQAAVALGDEVTRRDGVLSVVMPP